jgi:hypothetical protein
MFYIKGIENRQMWREQKKKKIKERNKNLN